MESIACDTSVLKDLPTDPKGIAAIGTTQCLQVLRVARWYPGADPRVIFHCGSRVLQQSGLSAAELADTMEQVIIAALQCGETKMAKSLVKKLKSQFGAESRRVRLLDGALCEAAGTFSDALAIYDSILEERPFDGAALRKRIACLASASRPSDAIDAAKQYLVTYPNDAGVHTEAAYIALSNFMSLTIAEEFLFGVVALDPRQPHVLVDLADVLVGREGADSLQDAVKYYFLALGEIYADARAVPGGNSSLISVPEVRALWSLFMLFDRPEAKLDAAAKDWVRGKLLRHYSTGPLKEAIAAR